MDAILAVVSTQPRDTSADVAKAMFDRLWPDRERRDAIQVDRGVILGISHCGGEVDPTVRVNSGVLVVSRWDWPGLVPGLSPVAEWSAQLSSVGPSARPHATLPTCLAWLPACRTLIACRDALGEGSLWYAADGARLAVSSHPAPLLALEWVPSDPDPVGRTLIGLGRAPGDLSPWRMIRRLPAGHRLTFCDGSAVIGPWWQLAVDPEVRRTDDAVWIERARSALEAAVARRIPAAGLVGSQLSGGLDSTGVSLVASRCLAQRGRVLHTFSHLPAVRWTPPRDGDETPFVEAALGSMPNAIPHACTDQGGEGTRPDGRPLLAHDRSVQLAAREVGVVCLLSGWGGDEGMSYNGDGFLAGELLHLRLHSLLRWSWRSGNGTLRGLAGVLLYKVIYQQFGFLRPTPAHPDPSRRSRREQLQSLSGEARLLALRCDRASRRLRAAAGVHENQRRLLSSPHIANRIDADAEWSIPAGFCFRYPLLDPELLQVVLQVPERLYVLNGRTRTLIREALRDLYPDLILNRRGKFTSHPKRPKFRPVE